MSITEPYHYSEKDVKQALKRLQEELTAISDNHIRLESDFITMLRYKIKEIFGEELLE